MRQDKPYHAAGHLGHDKFGDDTFAAACRAADAKRTARKRTSEDDYLDFLRELMADDVSLERAYYAIHAKHFEGRAAAATVEALMYSLRQRGTAALKEAQTQRRLAALSEEQLREVAARLQRLKPHIAKAWSGDEIDHLLETWDLLHGE